MTSRLPASIGICTLAVALVACTPVTTDGGLREAQPAEAKAGAEAEEVYRGYLRALSAVDPAEPDTLAPLTEFTTPGYHFEERAQLEAMYKRGVVFAGESRVDSFHVTSVDSDLSVEATACLDMSDISFRDEDGETYSTDETPDFFETHLIFVSRSGELLLDRSVGMAPVTCPSGPDAPTPETNPPAVPDIERKPWEEGAEFCTTYPDDIRVCTY